jgi:hypothetical protein
VQFIVYRQFTYFAGSPRNTEWGAAVWRFVKLSHLEECESFGWIELAQDKDRWDVVVWVWLSWLRVSKDSWDVGVWVGLTWLRIGKCIMWECGLDQAGLK